MNRADAINWRRRKGRGWLAIVPALLLTLTACGGSATVTVTPSGTPAAATPVPATPVPATPVPATPVPATPAGSTPPPVTETATPAASEGATPPPSEAAGPSGAPTALGPGEGAVKILAWPGYVEDGSTDPTVDWVTKFQTDTGCAVTFDVFGTSDEAFNLFKNGDYDLISASGDASGRLVDGGYVAPVNVDLVPNYVDIVAALKDQPYNTFGGVHYGIPHGRGANLLMWRTDVVSPAPQHWSAVFDPASPFSGKVTAYDAPIYIADAAVVLMQTKPDLGITDPYELDDAQFAAAVDLTKGQRPLISEYWSDYTKEISSFENKDSVIGTTWQIITNLLKAEKPAVPVKAIKPDEGSTGWSDTWMISSKAAHPNCAYMYMNYEVSPAVNAAVAEWFGEAPANLKACSLTADPNHCQIFHAQQDQYWDNVHYWKTPNTDCGDGRGSVCKGFDDWLNAWTDIKG